MDVIVFKIKAFISSKQAEKCLFWWVEFAFKNLYSIKANTEIKVVATIAGIVNLINKYANKINAIA